jgi:hypothetical protein
MQSQNEEAAVRAPRAAGQAAAPQPLAVQTQPFYLTDKSLRDGKINPNWTLDSPGTQTYGSSVFFPRAFGATPNVEAGITGINADASDAGDWTVQMTVVKVEQDHFDVVVSKQGDIKIHLVNAVWVAWTGG